MADDFPKAVKTALESRAGSLCSNPDCRALTSGPQKDPSKAVNVGVAAHITAASFGGPRYDHSLLSDERSGALNGIWLCQTCAKLIDNDTAQYTADLLKKWKDIAETEVRNRVGKTAVPMSIPARQALNPFEEELERHVSQVVGCTMNHSGHLLLRWLLIQTRIECGRQFIPEISIETQNKQIEIALKAGIVQRRDEDARRLHAWYMINSDHKPALGKVLSALLFPKSVS